MKQIFYIIGLLFYSTFAFSQEQQLTKVKDQIYMIQDRGGNIGVSVGSDGIFMVDDQFAQNIAQTQKTIATLKNEPVQFLINTHHHGDHTGGNLAMAQTGTIIVSQENVRTRLFELLQEKKNLSEDALLPMVTFTEDISFHFNDEKIYIFHVHNAHTDGDAMVYFMGSNVLHMGDVFFKARYPYVDLKSDGSIKGYIKALSQVIMMIDEDTVVIPGHGDLATLKDVIFTRNMLQDIYDQVTVLAKKGMSEAEILKNKSITQKYDALDYGSGFITTEKMLQTAYQEISGNL